MVNYFEEDISHIELPSSFTYPFCYDPHPLCQLAWRQVGRYLLGREDLAGELSEGKMFGVMVVETPSGEVGFLAAFSGALAQSNDHQYFTPPIFDILSPGGYFNYEMQNISDINFRISSSAKESAFLTLKGELDRLSKEHQEAMSQARAEYDRDRKVRKEARKRGDFTLEQQQELALQSQRQKGAMRRMQHTFEGSTELLKGQIAEYNQQISALKDERKERSAALQKWLFSQYVVHNAKGESCNLWDLFASIRDGVPPAGSGECAGPKMLEYAYRNSLRPIAMAEFWWGASPSSLVRHHDRHYPCCAGRCGPILSFMMQGLDIDNNPLIKEFSSSDIEILYEDDAIVVVNKPSGMLSVSGKLEVKSLFEMLKERYLDNDELAVVHRLDMATSGIIIFAKSRDAHYNLQQQFIGRYVKKRYIALLDGEVSRGEGVIDLPLAMDMLNRPMQRVDYVEGKEAVTHFRVIGVVDFGDRKVTRIDLAPQSGRTHQLRLHSAHRDGLNCPIVGDELYGKSGARLYLHAAQITFNHPTSGERMTISCEPGF